MAARKSQIACDWNLDMARQLCLLSVISISYNTMCQPCVYWCDIFLVYSHLQYLLKAKEVKRQLILREKERKTGPQTHLLVFTC